MASIITIAFGAYSTTCRKRASLFSSAPSIVAVRTRSRAQLYAGIDPSSRAGLDQVRSLEHRLTGNNDSYFMPVLDNDPSHCTRNIIFYKCCLYLNVQQKILFPPASAEICRNF